MTDTDTLSTVDKPVDKVQVFSWGLWDWGSAAFNNIITTYVFSVYLTKSVAATETQGASMLGWGMGLGGLVIALLAPVTGQRSDAGGNRKFWLAVNTFLVCLTTAACFFVRPDESYLLLGIVLVALGNIFFQFAEVNNNAMLLQISTPQTIGKISGLGWAMGYVGGIVALLVGLVGFIMIPEGGTGWFGVTKEDGMNVRALTLFAAAWFFVFTIPLLLKVPEAPAQKGKEKTSIAESYRRLWRTIVKIAKEEPNTLRFLLSSAVFRDGLAAVFQFGAILAVGTYGLSDQDVIIFAVVGNLVAALGAGAAGWFDDVFGPKIVIIVSLAGLCVSGTALLFVDGPTAFWVCGLFLAIFVGPAQSSSRTFLARLARVGNEGELFGLYATTGRAVSFLAPMLFSLSITIALPFTGEAGAQRWGIVGIVGTIFVGLVMLLWVASPKNTRESTRTAAAAHPGGGIMY